MRNPDDYRNEFWIHINPGDFYQQKGQRFMADCPIELPLSEFQGDEIGQFDEEAITSAIVAGLKNRTEIEAMVSAVKSYITYERSQKRWVLKEKILASSWLTSLYCRILLYLHPSDLFLKKSLVIYLISIFCMPGVALLLNNDMAYYFLANEFFLSVADFINSFIPMSQTLIKRSVMAPEKLSLILTYAWFSGLLMMVILKISDIPCGFFTALILTKSRRILIIRLSLALLCILCLWTACFITPYGNYLSTRGGRISLTHSLIGPGRHAASVSVFILVHLFFVKLFLFQRRLPSIRRHFERLVKISD